MDNKERTKSLAIISLFGIILLSFAVFNISYVSAAGSTACKKDIPKGGKLCAPYTSWQCTATTCGVCIKGYDSTNNCYKYASDNPNCDNYCAGGDTGGSGGGGGGGSTSAPAITITNPSNHSLYNKRTLPLGISLDQTARIYYTQTNPSRNQWSTACSQCSSFLRNTGFKEGENDLTVKAVNSNGASSMKTIIFFIDSQKPVIHSYGPKVKYADGNFSIEYSEANFDKITLFYADKSIIMPGCASGKKQSCSAKINLSAYNGQTISYYYSVRDKAGNIVTTQTMKIVVDTAPPVLNSITSVKKFGKIILFTLDITESNFDKAVYIDSLDKKPMEKRLCSALVKGICKYQTSFANGAHNLTIEISDKAGNSITKNYAFSV